LDLDFIAIKLPSSTLTGYAFLAQSNPEGLRFMVGGKTNRLGAGHSP